MIKRAVFFVFMILFAVCSVFAQRGSLRSETIQIRFASVLPRNSDFGRNLDRMAAEWARVTNNAVNVTVSHDGREGNEQDMVTGLSNNSIQAALFSSSGVAEICPAVVTMSVPFLIKSNNELDAVLGEVSPVLNTKVHNDFVVIAWAKAGWLYIFTKEPVFTPSDLRRQRISTSAELKDMNFAFRTMGFQLVESDMLSLGTKLASGAINAIYFIPTAIAPLQLHRHLNHMLDLPIGPVLGAVVVNRVTWNRLTSEQQRAIIESTRRTVVEFNASIPRSEAAAISAMNRDGLSVNKPTSQQEALWTTELDSSVTSLIGTVFDRDIYQRIIAVLDKVRSGR